MKIVSLKSGHIQIYKRENSKFWQMKIKLPKVRAIRSSTGSKILKEAETIALKYYKNISSKTKISIKRSNNIFKKIHLVETADLSKKEIEYILEESKKYISFNKKDKSAVSFYKFRLFLRRYELQQIEKEFLSNINIKLSLLP